MVSRSIKLIGGVAMCLATNGVLAKKGSEPIFRTTFHIVREMKNYDPIDVSDSVSCVINRDMHSTLMHFDSATGQYVSGLAEKFYWEKNKLYLELRPDLKSPDGKNRITTQEIAFSFMRLFKNRPLQIPGNIHKELCKTNRIESLKDCEGIKIIDDLKLSLSFKFESPRYLEYLNACVMGIVPEYIVDSTSGKIKDYTNTTGLYNFVSEDEKVIKLKANEAHWLYTSKMPKRVQILKDISTKNQVQDAFRSGKLDFISSFSKLGNDEKQRLASEVPGSVFYKTIEIGMASVLFSKKGMNIPLDERIEIARLLREKAVEYRQKKGKYDFNTQHAVPGGHGSVSEREIIELYDKFGKPNSNKLPRKVTMSTLKGRMFEMDKEIFGSIENLEIVPKDSIEAYEEMPISSDMPDLISTAYDLNYFESFGKLSWLLQIGAYPIRGEEADQWFEKYSKLSRAERISELKKLNRQAVFENPSVIPLWVFSFSSLVNGKWDYRGSPYWTSNYLWNMKSKN